MKSKIILISLFSLNAMAFGTTVPSSSDYDNLLAGASKAVKSYAQDTYGLNSVQVTYDFVTRTFTASDLDKNCSFQADTPSINFIKGSFNVVEVDGTNTCF